MKTIDVYVFNLWFRGLLYFSWMEPFLMFSGKLVYWQVRKWYTHVYR